MSGRFEGRAVVVTGAGSGFGREMAVRFAGEGASVVVADISDQGQAVAGEITDAGGEAIFQRTDVSRSGEVEAMIEACIDRFGHIDVLVNNAGYSHRSMLMWKVSEADFDGVWAVNVKGVFLGCKFAIPHMIEDLGESVASL